MIQNIETENQLNKLLKTQKEEKSNIQLLFMSEWDEHCNILKEKLEYWGEDLNYPDNIFLVSSFDTPHSFVIFKVRKCPTLVHLDADNIYVESYLPMIYSHFGLE